MKTPPIVLALQTFFSRAQSDAIAPICRDAVRAMPGGKCAFDEGAVLHMTTGSWQVDAGQLEAAVAGFSEKVGPVEPLTLRVSLEERSFRSGTRRYFLTPEVSEPLLAFHAEIHRRLAYPFPAFRKQDVVGNWLPHLTLIEGPEAAVDAAQPYLDQLRLVTTVETAAVALVTFGPIHPRAVVETRR